MSELELPNAAPALGEEISRAQKKVLGNIVVFADFLREQAENPNSSELRAAAGRMDAYATEVERVLQRFPK